jgi:signal transduction histidine kinase
VSLASDLGGRAPRHAVQFYEGEEYLYARASAFLAEGIASGASGLVVATDVHRRGIADALAARGIDAVALTFADARETLTTFMRDGAPDFALFRTSIGGILDRLGPRACVYGEMVDLLWRDGQRHAAIRLEELWNELAATYDFTLLCAYPMTNFGGGADASLFDDVCATHASVLPAESFSAAEEDERLREIARLQQRAAALEAAIEEKSRLYRIAVEANRTKDEFLATLSHELRTPLTAILGWANMLALGLDEATTRVAIETIERSARAQAALVDSLLDLSRIVTGKLRLASELVDVAEAVAGAVQTLRLAADAKGVRLELGTTRAVVLGDPTRLQQIVWNLLSNAVKFSEPGGVVEVNMERDDERVRIAVRDSGRGISPEFLPHVFEAFRQADGASTRMHGGLGLGLAIVKHLAEHHGGQVEARSDGEGCGATFTVTLPLAMRRIQYVDTQPAEIVPDLTGSIVLLVDDDADTRELVTAILRRCGATVCAAESVLAARASIDASRPHVVVTDIAMPGEDGYSLLRHLDGIPAVALTASPDAEERLHAAGFRAYVRKPIDPLHFARVVAGCRNAVIG